MIRSIRNYFYNRAASSGRQHPLYIVPTADGLKVIALNVTLLVIGLVYANNYVLLFNFILFCLFLGSMFYTHFNLSGIKLESVVFPSFHAKEESSVLMYFSTSNSQGHHFIRPYFKSSLVKVSNNKETFSIKSDEQTAIRVSVSGKRRGKETINAVYLETLFPFNFFRCFTFFNINQDIYLYPERANLRLHTEETKEDPKKEDGEEFHIRDYIPGDSLKRVDWKKLAQTNRWYTREFQTNLPDSVMLILDKNPSEEALKSLCYAIYDLHHQNIKFGLKLKDDLVIPPDNSPRHLTRCLRELAGFHA